MKITGRIPEQKILAAKMASGEAELIAVYGRRRVGKTYLVRTFFKDALVFEFIGIHEASMKDQLENFAQAMQKWAKSAVPLATPENWMKAFQMLDSYINSLPTDKPAVIFLDEFPWIHSQKSGFLAAFDHWWNASASTRPQLKVIICGSAASWMIDNIINNRGGLHNRVTQTIRLLPFNLAEMEEYLKSRGSGLDRYQLLQLYMAMGGIPHYLKNVLPGESAAQVIDKLCFTKDGLLRKEFDNLYKSLFANSTSHELVVRTLAKKAKGLTRTEIINECKFTSGGTTTKILKELEESGFITPYIPFEKMSNDSIYKLSDEYSLFYIKFIESISNAGEGTWLRQFSNPSYVIWSGFAFESICHKHVLQVKKALGIEAVMTQHSVWRYAPGKGGNGAQIDLLLDRQDRCINICEMKFSNDEYTITKKYADELDAKVNIFRIQTRAKKTIFPTMITTYGTRKNEYYGVRVQGEVMMDDLFL
jgi:predicted AAA+ superfamily ATPase